VWPICHTIPALTGSTVWLEQASKSCPGTVELLRTAKVKTALFSRMKPGEKLQPHRGWADLSNHVLRCHILVSPSARSTVTCGGEVREHEYGSLMVFDDSKLHHASNDGDTDRFVLIFDVERPEGAGKGEAEEGYTEEVRGFVQRFK